MSDGLELAARAAASNGRIEHAATPAEIPEWAMDARRPIPAAWVQEAFGRLLVAAERHTAARDGLADTPARAARAWAELTCGYTSKLDVKTFDSEGHDEIVAVTHLPFYSLCEHHLLPFHGTVDFAYLPDQRILGLSKFARILEHYSRRLQVQERLTTQLADCLDEHVSPRAVFVIIRAEHLCMAMRGVQRPGHTTVTSVVRGLFKEDVAARHEALTLIGGNGR